MTNQISEQMFSAQCPENSSDKLSKLYVTIIFSGGTFQVVDLSSILYGHVIRQEIIMTFILEDELECALKCLEQASKQYESLQKDWQLKEANYVQKQVELVSKNDALRAQSQDLSQKLYQVETDFKAYKNQHEGYGDKIIALRSVARALEFENQLLTGEKEHLQQFKTDYCNKNGALK